MTLFLLVMSGGQTYAQPTTAPTFSLEAVAVEGNALPEPVSSIRVGPGERILAKIFLRDWSPNGEVLRAYQAELEPTSYKTGDAGSVSPVNYEEKLTRQEANPTAAYIDDKDPLYVHSGLHIIPITDTLNATGYRWLTVLLNADDGPVALQDGKKYYLGTVELEASPDAAGTFTIGFVEDPNSTGLLNLQSEYILGLRYESLTVMVDPKLVRLMIRESDPPDGAIDARLASRLAPDAQQPWSEVAIRFNLEASMVSKGDFVVSDGTDIPPSVVGVSTDGERATVRLSSPIKPGRWTDLTYEPTGARVRLGYLPGDVTNDGRTDSADVIALVEVLNGGRSLPAYRTDLDRDGDTTPADLVALVDLISGIRTRGGEALAAK